MILQLFSSLHNDFSFSINFIFLDEEVLLKVNWNTSTPVFPVTKKLLEFLFCFNRLHATQSVVSRYKVLISSIVTLLNSSGKGKYKLFVRSHVSTLKGGIFI